MWRLYSDYTRLLPGGPLAAADAIAITIDLGGTQFRVAAVSQQGEMLARIAGRSQADAEPSVVIRDLIAAVTRVRHEVAGRAVLGLGIAAPGPIDESARVVLIAPNFPRWRDIPLADELERATGLPAYLGNDANLAGLGEHRYGAGRGVRNMVYLTVSTGIGGGIIVENKLLLGERGAAGEAGHMQISFNGPPCSCGNRGCLEAYASGHGLANQAREAIAGGTSTSLAEIDGPVTAIHIARAAEAGDPFARDLVTGAGRALGVGVRNLIHIFDPAIVVIGGGVSQMGPLLWNPMREVVQAEPYAAFQGSARVEAAALKDDCGLAGAAVMVFEPEAAGMKPRVHAA
ncbi:MAG: glucokinase [Chloroflexota bacterium]|jgi:glucokinase|nr:glucokinase [Chloroflexota bacterium]